MPIRRSKQPLTSACIPLYTTPTLLVYGNALCVVDHAFDARVFKYSRRLEVTAMKVDAVGRAHLCGCISYLAVLIDRVEVG